MKIELEDREMWLRRLKKVLEVTNTIGAILLLVLFVGCIAFAMGASEMSKDMEATRTIGIILVSMFGLTVVLLVIPRIVYRIMKWDLKELKLE